MKWIPTPVRLTQAMRADIDRARRPEDKESVAEFIRVAVRAELVRRLQGGPGEPRPRRRRKD